MKKIAHYLIILLCCFLASCSTKTVVVTSEETNEKLTYFPESVEDIYGDYVPMLNTTVKFTYTSDAFEFYEDDIYELMAYYHKLLDAHHYYRNENDELMHNICYLNDYYGNEEGTTITDDMMEILNEAIQLSKLTNGYFNPFIGCIGDVYDNKFSSFPIECEDPDQAELDNALASVIPTDKMEEVLEINDNTVIFHSYNDNESVKIDLGAFAKGYVLDKVAEYLKEKDIECLIDEGTSSIYSLNKTSNIGISSPKNRYASLFTIILEPDHNLSTSGDGSKYYLKRNEDDSTTIRCHIINPYTGYSETKYRDVTVISDGKSVVSDVLSTALFSITDEDECLNIIKELETIYECTIDFVLTSENNDQYELATTLDASQLKDVSEDVSSITELEKK